VAFVETGLPAGTSWSITLEGTEESSVSSGITFAEPNGSYRFDVGPVDGFAASPTSVSGVTVNGTGLNVSVTFAPVAGPIAAAPAEPLGPAGIVVWAGTIAAAAVAGSAGFLLGRRRYRGRDHAVAATAVRVPEEGSAR
jgi:hypothetical protein